MPKTQERERKNTMLIVTNNHKNYELPPPGVHPSVIAAVQDLGICDRGYGLRPRVRIVHLVSPKLISVLQSLHLSWNESSKLRRLVRDVLGRDPGDTFDLHTLVGRNIRVLIKHVQKDGRTFANVAAILPREACDELLSVPPDFKPPAVNNKTELSDGQASRPTPTHGLEGAITGE
jgi:hypothetical protein